MTKAILLVEDNPTDEKLALRAFQRCGFGDHVTVVRDGAEAVEHLLSPGGVADTHPESLPAVVVLDLKMPRLDGFGVIERLRADPRTRAVPIVILTGSREDADIERAYALGANAYVRKALEFPAFAETVAAIAAFWVRLNTTTWRREAL